MKQYFTIIVALLSYGCVTQQPKETPPQDNGIKSDSAKSSTTQAEPAKVEPSKVDSKQISSPRQTHVTTSKVIIPTSSSKARPKKKVTKAPVIKKQPVESTKTALPTVKPVKSDSSQLSSSKQIEPGVESMIPSDNSIGKQTVESTPLLTNEIESEDSVTVDSEQVITDNLIDSEVVSETNLESEIEPEKQVNEATLAESNNLDFDLEKLPLNFGDTWFLDRNKDKVSNTTRCLLNSRKKNFNDGYSDSKISLQLTTDTLLIKTNASIDLTYPDVGLLIDQNKPFPLKNLYGETSILIKKNLQQITSQLRDGEKLTVKLGFWPTWPKTETRSIDFSLSDFNEAYQSFLACEKL